MRIPKYIDKLLERRAKAAVDFLAADNKIVEWLDKNDIKVSSDHILTGACSLCEPYDSIEIIRECIREKETKEHIVRANHKDLHRHSLALIKNTFEETPDKYLLYYDERWQCRLFPNWKSKENQEEDLGNIKRQLSLILQINKETIQGQLWFEKTHEKYSVSTDKDKWYHHSFYDIQISEFPDLLKQPDFVINGKHFCWMSIAEMKENPRIMEVNADIVGMIKKVERS